MDGYFTFVGAGRPYAKARPSAETAEFLRGFDPEFIVRQKRALSAAIGGDSRAFDEVRQTRRVSTHDLSSVDVSDIFIPRNSAGGELRLRVYRPKSGAVKGLLLYLHGGGWSINSPENCERVCRDFAEKDGFVVAAPDYLLAPEFPYPAGNDDAKTAYAYLAETAAKFGANASDIFLAGDSAGGHMALYLALELRGDNAVAAKPAGVVAFYPALDLLDTSRESFGLFGNGYALNDELMKLYIKACAPTETELRKASLFNKNLAGLPPVLIVAGECDILRQEAEEFHQKLSDAGVKARYVCIEGAVHMFITKDGMEHAYAKAFAEAAEFFARAKVAK